MQWQNVSDPGENLFTQYVGAYPCSSGDVLIICTCILASSFVFSRHCIFNVGAESYMKVHLNIIFSSFDYFITLKESIMPFLCKLMIISNLSPDEWIVVEVKCHRIWNLITFTQFSYVTLFLSLRIVSCPLSPPFDWHFHTFTFIVFSLSLSLLDEK